MLKVGNIYKFEIIDIGMNFEGIAKDDEGLTVFIPDVLKGEVVEAKIKKVNKSFAVAECTKIIQASNKRCEVDCTTHSKCGGCAARHTDYDTTLDVKYNNAVNTLKKQGIEEKIDTIYGMGNPYYYRNKVQYPVREVNGKTRMGMFHKASHNLVEVKECLIQDKITNMVAQTMFESVLKNNLIGYNENLGTGDIRNIMVRRGIHTGEVMCVLVVNYENLKQDKRILNVVKEVTMKFNEITSFVINVNDKKTNVILSNNNNVCLYGNEYITDKIGDYIFKITADSFFQVNTIQAEVLYNVLKENMNLEKDKTLLELYSGVGSIGVFLADSVKDIYSVEIVKSAVLAAKENARLNGITNIINVEGDATKETLELVKKGRTFDYLVVDPPRKGLDLEGIELILKLKPKKLGYVSCNVSTLARDLNLLKQGGYEIQNINLVDMFPWTTHVECVTTMRLK